MIDAATLRQGDEILIRAIVDRVTGSAIAAHVGSGFATITACDVVEVTTVPRLVRYGACRGNVAPVVFEHGEWMVLDTPGIPTVQHRTWVEDVTPINRTTACPR